MHSCAGLVHGIAAEFRNGFQDDDLVQAGFLGLLNAIEHYDPDRGTPFVGFARHFVRGEIQHYLRDHQGLIRRPRWLGERNGQIEDAVGRHLAERGRYPGLGDLARSLDLDVESLTQILQTRQVVRTLSLDAEDGSGQPMVDPGCPRDPAEESPPDAVEDRVMLIDALERLNPLQRTVVFYIFFTDLTQAQTAARMGISQKHVSRVLASALYRLRLMLAPAFRRA
ncbi:MAG: sigma-70 family RNA polymerase sigma factor [Armatimonadota bacterium]|nr:sigma-70 family RNA polymerase sigma factor [Armatimonadota bacterium]